MANTKNTNNYLWLNKSARILVMRKNGKITACWKCPCNCYPRVIASTVTNRSDGRDTWDLTPYQGIDIGTPGAMWRLRDVGEAHSENANAACSGTIYNVGTINASGQLVGLPDKVVSKYNYNGYMELQEGCIMGDGSIAWPCP